MDKLKINHILQYTDNIHIYWEKFNILEKIKNEYK